MKTCKYCGTEKPLEDFGIQHNVTDGRKATCKACTRMKQAKYDAIKKVKLEAELVKNPNYIEDADELPTLKHFPLKIGDKVKFLKSWDSDKKTKYYGYGVVIRINDKHYTLQARKYKETFLKFDYGRNAVKVGG